MVPARITAAVLSILWALFVLPPQVLDWSGRAGAPAWVTAMYDGLGYRGIGRWLAGIGLGDSYLVWGVAIVGSILLAWWAMRPASASLGWSGRVLDWGWIAFAVATVLGYLNWPEDAPLHALWGADGILLAAVLLWAVAAAILGREASTRIRVLTGLTPAFGVAGTLIAGYWPHSTMLGIGALAVLLALRRPAPAGPGPVTPSGAAASAPAGR